MSTLTIEDYVFRFHVSVNHHFAVKVVQSQKNWGSHEFCLSFWKWSSLWQMIAEISSFHQVHQQIEALIILKSIQHIYNKLVSKSWEKLSFVENRVSTTLRYDSTSNIKYIAFDISFIAKRRPVLRCSTFHTFPKPPFPIIFRYRYAFFSVNIFSGDMYLSFWWEFPWLFLHLSLSFLSMTGVSCLAIDLYFGRLFISLEDTLTVILS